MQQLPLTVGLPQSYNFENFYVANDNKIIVNTLKQFCLGGAGPVIGIQGGAGSGKSHLLQATVANTGNAVYLPMADLVSSQPMDVLAGLENFSAVCIDDVDAVFGREAWEHALFHFYNRLSDAGTSLLFTSSQALAEVQVQLPDLLSRLRMALLFRLNPLSDFDKQGALSVRAEAMGLELGADVSAYILRHCDRNMAALMQLLLRLDRHCLKLQRKPSVKMLSEMIAADNAIL